MFHLILFAICISTFYITAVNSWGLHCEDYSCYDLPYECKCSSYDLFDCPDECGEPTHGLCGGPIVPCHEQERKCSYYNQDNCPLTRCGYSDCNGYSTFAWYWYLVIVGVILAIIVLIIVIVCIRASMGSRRHEVVYQQQSQPPVVVAQPQYVQPQPQIVATVNI
uniref:Uncharacterized protein n=1 Tax=Panagrolaimus davidi TaxID=227884 RepID=A0A914PXX3_9BILA